MILNLLYRKDTKIFLDFLLSRDNNWMEQTSTIKKLLPANLFAFLKANSFNIIFMSILAFPVILYILV